MDKFKELINNIRHVLVNESFNLFARNGVIDLGHLSDLHVTSLQMAGFTMMSDEFQEQFNILMKIYSPLNELVGYADGVGAGFAQLNEQFKPYGFEVFDIDEGQPLPWKTLRVIHKDLPTWEADRALAIAQRGFEPDIDGDTVSEPVIATVGTTVLVCKPFSFIIDRYS